MINTEEEKLRNIILNENAYFYSKPNAGFLSENYVNQMFIKASEIKKGNYLLRILPKQITLSNSTIVKYSVIVFKYDNKPTFIEENIEGWIETKLAYLFLVDFENYIVILRRNISNISDYLKDFEPIDYEILISAFSNDDTVFEKFQMNNINISDTAIRQKTLESNNLKETITSKSLNTYILNSTRIKNGDKHTNLVLNTSRINNLGGKKDIDSVFKWATEILEKLSNANNQNNSLFNSFAQPIKQNINELNLKPKAILFSLSKLYDDLHSEKINRCYIKYNDKEKDFDICKILDSLDKYFYIKDNNGVYTIDSNTIIGKIKVSVNKKTITLQSDKLANVFIEFSNEYSPKLIQHINNSNEFIITFDNAEYVYNKNKIFKDGRLLSDIDSFMKIFLPKESLLSINSEKGDILDISDTFNENSLFNFIEKELEDKVDYLVCDDLGKEWADYISIKDNEISFLHAKSKNSNFSASAFQEVVGQALKNLGNLTPTIEQLEQKKTLWQNNYPNSSIKRMRKGEMDDFVDGYKMAINHPNIKKTIYLVVNFISKQSLHEKLQKLNSGESFREKNEIIQILWILSSLVSTIKESNADIYIYCKP